MVLTRAIGVPLAALLVVGMLAAGSPAMPRAAAASTATATAVPATDTATATPQATATMTPTATAVPAPKLTVSPDTAAPGGQVSVSGSGFESNEIVDITIGGSASPLASPHADSSGVLASTPITIPFSTQPGSVAITATGQTSKRAAMSTITVNQVSATLVVSPTTTNRGGLVTITGTNFAANEPITISVEGVITPLATLTATAQGAITSTGVAVPYFVPTGAHTLQAAGGISKRTATASLTVAALTPALTLSASSASPGNTLTITGTGFGRQEQVTLSLNGAALSTTPSVITTTASGGFTATLTVPSSILRGSNTISAIGNESRVSAVATLTGNLPTATTIYFAGASTMSGEHASMSVLNTNAQPAHLDFTFYYQSGAPGHGSIDVPAHTRGTADLDKLAGANHAFGVKLVADRGVTAQLSVARDGKDDYGLLGASAPNKTWYLAEGYTGLTFHETLAIVNPSTSTASVRLRLLPFGGRTARQVTETVAPNSTYLVNVNNLMANQSLSIIANASAPVVLERTLTFSKEGIGGANGYGATAKLGTNTPATSWIFAEGTTTTRFQTFLTILNPNTTPARVTASFYGQTGGSLGSRTIIVSGLSRANIKLNDFLHASGIASVVTSNLPVVVERPEYFGSPNDANIPGSDVFGRNGAGLSWSFPSGNTNHLNEYLLIYNPSAATVAIDATFYGSDGKTMTKRLYVPPTVRYNVNVNTIEPTLAAQHGITLHSANKLGFVAEQTIFAPNFSTLRSTEGSAQ